MDLLTHRFPGLARLPRVELGRVSPPVVRAELPHAGEMWIWRDDLNAPVAGGNKVRALEYLLGSVRQGDTVAVVGGVGSTHVYATATHAARLGASTVAVRWPHETTSLSRALGSLAAERCRKVHDVPLALAMPTVAALRLRTALSPGLHWVPFGGSSPTGILGHVGAALELAHRVERGELERPGTIVVPVGSSGTAAGLLLGLAIAGLDTTVIGARCGPRAGITHGRVMRLAARTAALVRRLTRKDVPLPRPARFAIQHDAYGGAYGRPHPDAAMLASELYERTGIVADATYVAKALLVAAAHRTPRPVMLWSTFDAREVAHAAEWWK